MGISGLKKIIKQYSKGSLSEININTLANTKIAIDSSILLYKFRYIYSNDDKFHIIGFQNTITHLRNNNITPVFVFDGKPPDAKKETIDKRILLKNKTTERIKVLKELIGDSGEEFIDDSDSYDSSGNNSTVPLLKELKQLEKNNLLVTRTHSNEVIDLLLLLGISFLKAPGEAEEYCAFLQKNGIVDYVLSEDTDSLTFGATKVLFSVPKNKYKYLLCNTEILLKDLELTEDEFIDFCILSGCDYTCTIPKIGPVTALKIIKKYSTIGSFILDNTKYQIPDNFNYSLSKELFIKNRDYPIPDILIQNIQKKEYSEYSFIN